YYVVDVDKEDPLQYYIKGKGKTFPPNARKNWHTVLDLLQPHLQIISQEEWNDFVVKAGKHDISISLKKLQEEVQLAQETLYRTQTTIVTSDEQQKNIVEKFVKNRAEIITGFIQSSYPGDSPTTIEGIGEIPTEEIRQAVLIELEG